WPGFICVGGVGGSGCVPLPHAQGRSHPRWGEATQMKPLIYGFSKRKLPTATGRCAPCPMRLLLHAENLLLFALLRSRIASCAGCRGSGGMKKARRWPGFICVGGVGGI